MGYIKPTAEQVEAQRRVLAEIREAMVSAMTPRPATQVEMFGFPVVGQLGEQRGAS